MSVWIRRSLAGMGFCRRRSGRGSRFPWSKMRATAKRRKGEVDYRGLLGSLYSFGAGGIWKRNVGIGALFLTLV